MLLPEDLRRLPTAALRARLTAHLVDGPGPNTTAYREIFAAALLDLRRSGVSIGEIAAMTFLSERDVRTWLLSAAGEAWDLS